MEYLLGLLTAVVFLLVFFIGIYVGTRLNHTVKQKPPDVDEVTKQNMKKLDRDFQKMMGYNETIARQRKEKVN